MQLNNLSGQSCSIDKIRVLHAVLLHVHSFWQQKPMSTSYLFSNSNTSVIADAATMAFNEHQRS